MPHHIVEAAKEQLSGKTKLSVPVHEVLVEVVAISGIGCSSNFPGLINTYGVHTCMAGLWL